MVPAMKSEARYSKISEGDSGDSGEHIPNVGGMWKSSLNISRKVCTIEDDGSNATIRL